MIQNDRSTIVQRLGSFIQGNEQNIDLNIIGTSIFCLEDNLKTNSIKKAEIPVYGQYDSDIAEIIQRIIFEATGKTTEIDFYEAPQKRLNGIMLKDKRVCLFSCGIDSFSGILNAQKKFGNVLACMTHHSDYKTIGKMLQTQKRILQAQKIPFKKFNAPPHKKGIRYSRGVLYLLNGLSLGHREIIVSECGTTMFQPKFAPFDTVTKTTNPELLLLAKSLAEKTLKKKIKIIEPNANLTKAEIIAACPDKNKIEQTHSCWTMRWCAGNKTHEGNCYGCITRQIGEIVAGVKDSTYNRTPLEEKDNTDNQICEILQLTRFSYSFLKDYTKLPEYEIENIIKYKKVDLFDRTAKDTFAALYLLQKKKKLNDPILKKWLERGLTIISKEKLQDRISEVRANKYKPNFDNLLVG